MAISHAVVWLDHHHAQVLRLDSADVQKQKIAEHATSTHQHGSGVRTQHEFFGHVCDALSDIDEVVVMGAHQSLADFKHYVNKHRLRVVSKIVGYEPVDRPTEGQLIAMARDYFIKYDHLAAGSANVS